MHREVAQDGVARAEDEERHPAHRQQRTGLAAQHLAKLWIAAIVAALLAWAIKHFGGHQAPVILAALVLVPYGLIYFGAAHLLGVDEAGALFVRALGIVRRK